MIDPQILNEVKKWFAGYLRDFSSQDVDLQQNISLKAGHTKRVCQEILQLGQKLELDPGELHFAELTALLHDIGRFEQYRRYGTFVDRQSVNHAQLGVEIVQRQQVLSRLDVVLNDLVLRVISYHNRAALPEQESATCLFFSQLLRDADKLDIWRVVTDYYRRKDFASNSAIELGLPDLPLVTSAVTDDLLAGKIVDFNNLQTLNDFKMLQIGWVFDLNFAPSFQRLREKDYLTMIRNTLPETAAVNAVFASVGAQLIWGCAHAPNTAPEEHRRSLSNFF